ncbi:MAG: cyanophycinase [Haliscomenobacter sp.]|nr:cyanophycinase [Haliscomenobacter sp.]
MARLHTLFLLLFFGSAGYLAAQSVAEGPVVGPARGSLVVVGGGALPDTIVKRFIELAGGPDAPIVVIPTAGGEPAYDQNVGKFLTDRGARNVYTLHTYDKAVANTDTFYQHLVNAKGVWFGGGRQWRLVDAYGGTLCEALFRNVLERGGVIGGSSAGATIQGSYLVRGDSKNNQVMMGDHQTGFGYLRNVAVDQHVLVRNRQFDLFEVMEVHPELLGIGIDESTAIVVQGDQFDVIGRSFVLMYDGKFWSREGSDLKKIPDPGKRFYFLRAGDRYDLKERKVLTRD